MMILVYLLLVVTCHFTVARRVTALALAESCLAVTTNGVIGVTLTSSQAIRPVPPLYTGYKNKCSTDKLLIGYIFLPGIIHQSHAFDQKSFKHVTICIGAPHVILKIYTCNFVLSTLGKAGEALI